MKNTNKKIFYENLNLLNKEFEEDFKIKFQSILDKGWYILGNEVLYFEEAFAKFCNAKYCVGVANGLDALELSIKALELPPYSEIIVPSNTYIASILAIINTGHIPILVEPNINTYNIDPDLIIDKLTNKTKAILVVHLYGKIAEMNKIIEISKNYNLKIIEDCAQSHGAKLNNIFAGCFGDLGAFSFYPTKNLGSLGDSGAIVTNNHDLYLKLQSLRNYGSEKKYYNKYIGVNSRLDEIQAAFLNVKLPYLNKINEHKKSLAIIYNNSLTSKVIKPISIFDDSHVFHIYNIRTNRRDELKNYLQDKNIFTEIHYPVAPNKQEGYINSLIKQITPISDEIHNTTLSLPISYANSVSDVEIVISEVNNFFNKI
jgi:dTDP-4-amino-4,6-dideoxygalactose transaminase